MIQIDDGPEIVLECLPFEYPAWIDRKRERLRRGTFISETFKDMYPLADDDETVIS